MKKSESHVKKGLSYLDYSCCEALWAEWAWCLCLDLACCILKRKNFYSQVAFLCVLEGVLPVSF
jgi:hypothetical protein